MAREVMFVGSVPLKPAMSVYKCACDHGLKPLMPRIPDGEQAGWIMPLLQRWANHPALEPSGPPREITRRPAGVPFFNTGVQLLSLKPGHSADELEADDLGIARGFEKSFREFKQAKAAGIVSPNTRFTATLPGPASTVMPLDVPPAQLFPVLNRMLRREIARILKIAPAEELAIQIDLAGEVESEEFRRRPDVWDSPLSAYAHKNCPFNETVSLVAEIASAVPEEVELGFHLCAIWHVDESQGQDLNVHVDWANELTRQTRRRIDYIHMPTTPEYDVRDFEPLKRLELNARTKLYLGVIHAADGIEGAARRIRAAAQVRPDFGVAAFCGLSVTTLAQARNPIPIEAIVDMHRAAAEAG